VSAKASQPKQFLPSVMVVAKDPRTYFQQVAVLNTLPKSNHGMVIYVHTCTMNYLESGVSFARTKSGGGFGKLLIDLEMPAGLGDVVPR
jgi:hypothetical protein